MSPLHNLGTSFWSWHKDNQKEISEFTQQDCRKKRTAKRLCVTNMTDLLLFCGDLHSSLCFLAFYKMTCLKEGEVRRKSFSNKIIVTLVTQSLPSSFFSHPVAWAHYCLEKAWKSTRECKNMLLSVASSLSLHWAFQCNKNQIISIKAWRTMFCRLFCQFCTLFYSFVWQPFPDKLIIECH